MEAGKTVLSRGSGGNMGNQLAEERRHRAARYEAPELDSIHPLPVSSVLLSVRCPPVIAPANTVDLPSATFNPEIDDARELKSPTSTSRYRVNARELSSFFPSPFPLFSFRAVSYRRR